MAPAMGFWRFMDDVHEMMFPMASLDWHKTPLIKPVVTTVDGIQKDAAQSAEVPSLDPATLNTLQSIADLSNQNKELLQEKANAIKWQDAASMPIKEAKDEAEISKQDAKAAKKAGLLMAAKIQKQLNESKTHIAALKSSNTRAGVEKNKADAKHHEEISVAEKRIEELQTMLVSAISHGRESIEVFEELFRLSQDMHNQLVAKDQKIAAKGRENKALQGRLDARSSTFADISEDAKKSREACNKMNKEKVKSEKAQKAAERTVGDLQREASRVKATTDRTMKSLQTKMAESEARVTSFSSRATKAEGDNEQLRRDLENTETARRDFEKREGELAARLAEFPTHAAGSTSQSMGAATTVPESETSPQISTTTADGVQVSKITKGSSKKNTTEEWKRDVRRELEKQNQTVLATERETMRQELDEENQTALATDRRSIYTDILGELQIEFKKELAKRKTEWETQHDGKKSELESHIRSQLETDFQNTLASHKTDWQTQHDHEKSQLESQIRTQLQTDFENELASQKSQLRTQLQADFENELANQKSQWDANHPISEAGPSSQRIADSENQMKVDEPEILASPTAVTSDNDMLLDSLSRESDETHLLMQEIAAAGLTQSSGAGTVLRELNTAKDALYEVKCELRKPDAVVNKNNLLHAVRGVRIDEHYIGKLSTTNRKVLIRQAIEANERLGYVNRILGTNNDVPKHATLKYLLEPLKTEDEVMTETEHVDVSEFPQIPKDFGTSKFAQTTNNVQYSAVPSTSPFTTVNGPASSVIEYPQIVNNGLGSSKFSQMINNARYSAAPSSSAFTTINGPASSTAPGTSPFLPTASRFGNMAGSSPSAPDYKSSPLPGLPAYNSFGPPTVPKSSPLPGLQAFSGFGPPTVPESSSLPGLQALNGFGSPAVPMVYQAPSKGVINPFEASHFGNKLSQDPIPAQNNQNNPASDGLTETKNYPNSKFKKTSAPILPQGEGPAPLVSATSDKDHEMNTGDNQPPLPVTPDQGSVAGAGSVPALPRKKKLVQGLRPKLAPKTRQAFGKKQDASSSVPAGQTPQGNPQAQVPTTEIGSSGVPRPAFTLEPNHAFDITPGPSLTERGTHLRAQQDPAEYQKPLKLFQIPEEPTPASQQVENTPPPRENKSTEHSSPSEPLPSQPETITPNPSQAETIPPAPPPGCPGWTTDMESHARTFLKDVEIEQVQIELSSLYPLTEHMSGLPTYLQTLKQELESTAPEPEPDHEQNEPATPEQPIGWTSQMTEFVEGSFCAGNDVFTTVNLFRTEIAKAFEIQGLDEHIERLRNDLVGRSQARAQEEERVAKEPLGWTEGMSAIIQGYLRKGDRDVELMVQSLEIVEPDALDVEGVSEYVMTLLLRFQTGGYVETG